MSQNEGSTSPGGAAATTPTGRGGKAKNRYKDTLNLPKTAFPMRANLVQNEPASGKRWDKMNLYEKLREVRCDENDPENKGRWSFHDGPPYTSGPLHLGHVLNKALKDFVVRSRSMMGYDVPFVPGWDCHGLPIEHKVMTELHESGKIDKLNSLDEDTRRMAIRRECAKLSEKFLKLQREQMKQLLTLADYENPYFTMQPEYEAGVLEVFSFMVRDGLVYRDLKPVHWSIDNQTALAEAELEYYDREDLSIYVHFDVKETDRLAVAFGVEEDVCANASFMIWTTTPWTLPANLAVAVHPHFQYCLVRLGDRVTVLARELIDGVAKVAELDVTDDDVLAECKGDQLLGLHYAHPFCERDGVVVHAEYVTLEDGTGLVHTAPGHGADDYYTGLHEGLDIYCPVLEDGTFDDTVPEWLRGKTVWAANDDVVAQLKSSGHLYHAHTFTHSYPHDWRGKTPVIFRATEQWFVDVNKPFGSQNKSLKERALEVTKSDVEFHPEWGRNRMRGMLESRPDWCLSRQRAWGLPIPVFFHGRDHSEFLMTEQSVMAVAMNVQKYGSDYWFTAQPNELLEGYDVANDAEAPEWFAKGLGEANGDVSRVELEKSHDIFDVWFESGSSWNPVMRGRGMGFPVELYLEGSDQHRGWFQLSLLCGLGSLGESPFKSLLTHGFTVDPEGRKMSKSLGNTLEVEDLLKKYGADVCRWWVASQNFENDIKAGLELFDVAGESYRKVRNTLRFLLSNLSDYEPGDDNSEFGVLAPTSLEAWVLAEYNTLAQQVVQAYERYEFRDVHNALYNFCNDTLSAVYCAAVKDRLYCDHPESARRKRTQRTMWWLADGLVRLLAPVLPHTADEAFQALWKDRNAKAPFESVHLAPFLVEIEGVSSCEEWSEVMRLRDEALQALEKAREANVVDNPLDARVNVVDANNALAGFADRARAESGEDFHVDFADLLGVSRVTLDSKANEHSVVSLADEPRCERSWKRDGTVKGRSDGGMLSDRDAEAVGAK